MGFYTQTKYKVKKGKKPSSDFLPRIQEWQDTTQALLSQEPGPPKYPIRWTSPKQRRFVFGFVLKRDAEGNIIPTRRTGYVTKWAVFVDYDAIDALRDWYFQLSVFLASINPLKKIGIGSPPKDGILIRIQNPAEYQSYVTGVSQQGFHIDTGWIHAPTIINKQRRILDGIMQDTGIL